MKKQYCVIIGTVLLAAGAVAQGVSSGLAPNEVITRWGKFIRGEALVPENVEEPSMSRAGLRIADRNLAEVKTTGTTPRKSAVMSLPWSEDFSNATAAREAFTIIDANGDGSTWNIGGGQAYSMYHYENAADDWLITPGLTVEAGHTYRLKFDAYFASYPERMEVKMGTSPTVASMTTMLVEPMDVTWPDTDDRRHISAEFTAVTSSPVYIGIHAISSPNQNKLCIKNMELVDVATVSPDPVYVTYYSEDFSNADVARAQMGVFDENNDGYTWIFEDNRACYDYSRDNDADDWLITPGVELEGGVQYLLKVDMYSRMTNFAETMTVKYGNAQSPTAMTTNLWGPTVMMWTADTDESHITIPFTPAVSGPVFIGFHVTSPANKYNAYISDIKIVREVVDAPAGQVTDVTLTPEITGNLTAVLSFKAPETDATGNPLASLDQVEVRRNAELVKTFAPVQPGQLCEFTDNVPAPGVYRYDITAYSGTEPGDVLSISSYIGPNVTEEPTNVEISESVTEPGIVTLSWTAPQRDVDGNPVNQANVTYTILEYLGSTFALVAEGITDTSHTFRAIADGQQEFKTYVVTAVTARGMSYPGIAPTIPVGTPYEMPVKMSFTNEDLANCCIMTYVSHERCDWRILLDNSGLVSQDHDDSSVTFFGEAEGDKGELWLGKITIPADCANPVLSYWVNKVDVDDDNFCGAYVTFDGQMEMLPTTTIASLENIGWNHVIAPLPANVRGKTVNVVMCAELSTYTVVSIDNITVFDMLPNDMAVSSFKIPSLISPGYEAEGEFVIDNLGVNVVEAGSYAVRLTRNGVFVKEFETPEMRSGAQSRYTFSDLFNVCAQPEQTYRVEVIYAQDLDTRNNSCVATLKVLLPEYPAPTTLDGEFNGSMLTLTWEAPDLTQGEPEVVTEGFENAESFTSRVEGWTFVDEDGHDTGDFVEHPIPCLGEGVKSSFFVFDIPGMFEGAEMWYTAHGGDKFLASFFITDDEMEKSDWAISPLLSGVAQTISFWAKSYSGYRAESIEVYASADGTDLSDFTLVANSAGETRVDGVPTTWTEYEYTLPAGTRYFAIRSCGKKTFMLKIDDVTFERAPIGATLTLEGYNVYRNAEQLNNKPLSTLTYVDTEASDYPGAVYHVSAVYDRGESCVSNPFSTVSSLVDLDTSSVVVRGLTGMISITGATSLPIAVYTASGASVCRVVVSEMDAVTIPMAPGIYLVTVGSATYKVTVR